MRLTIVLILSILTSCITRVPDKIDKALIKGKKANSLVHNTIKQHPSLKDSLLKTRVVYDTIKADTLTNTVELPVDSITYDSLLQLFFETNQQLELQSKATREAYTNERRSKRELQKELQDLKKRLRSGAFTSAEGLDSTETYVIKWSYDNGKFNHEVTILPKVTSVECQDKIVEVEVPADLNFFQKHWYLFLILCITLGLIIILIKK